MRVKVTDAAKVMGTTCLTIQCMMKQGIISIGDILPSKRRNTYIIQSALLAKHIGVTEEELLKSLFKQKGALWSNQQ
jgi:hypothetical protein